MEFNEDRIYCLIGKNGSGKSTLLNLILQIRKAKTGFVKLTEKMDIGVMNGEGFYESLTIYQNLSHHCILHSYKNDEIDFWLKEFELWEERKKKISKLSYGMRQKVAFIKSIIGNPDILILDEPFNGLDNFSQKKIIEMINKFIKQKGKIVIVASHLLQDLENEYIDYIYIDEGRIRKIIKSESIKTDYVCLKFMFKDESEIERFINENKIDETCIYAMNVLDLIIITEKGLLEQISLAEEQIDYEIIPDIIKALEGMIGNERFNQHNKS